ncbi:helix-turn-helix transcriptional regulator [Tissierella carlieri]|uniref:helix-turn-helix domain-containing protein n=1 Tax=Tissierella carlieri TaxID=689904 RepID=UPI001C1074EE|nr:helix-turn-helix transcriptional regulator [Tissierella carlieri]MBU5311046.1 helix-turn-helix transcriptional regulator [Tissierella carlieri]
MVDVNLRELLQEYVQEKGIKYKYIAKEINVSESMLSHWRAGRKKLSESNLRLLEQIIKNN